MGKIRVAMLTSYLPYSRGHGSLTYVNKLTHHLSCRDDVELHIITFGNENKQSKEGNLDIHMIKRMIKHLGQLSIFQVSSLKRKIMEIAPDIVNAHGGTSPPYSIAATLVQNKYPVVLTTVGIISNGIKYEEGVISLINALYMAPIQRYVISKIPNLIVETSSIKKLVSQWTKSRMYIVPGGVEFEMVQAIEPYLNEKPDILYIGRLAEIKGADMLIKAIPLVMKTIPNPKVCIGGAGKQENKLKKLVKKLNLENNVRFLGFISEEEKYRYYKACKVAIVPSRWDCQPYTLFDAAASGKPVIASDMSNPGIVEDGKTGLLFKSENIEDLANKIIILLREEGLREEMGRAAKEKVKDYDWSKIAEKTVGVYKEVISDFHEQRTENKHKRKIL